MTITTITTGSTGVALTDGAAVATDSGSGVSWAAIFAGATAAAALSLILLVLGVGLGFAATSPWTATAGTAATLGGAAIAWLAFTQIAASAIGGYLAGRLRSVWSGLHGDEVYFRDTAHGLLAWGVATLVTAAFLGGAVAGVLGTAAKAGGEAVKGVATAAMAGVAGAGAADNGSGPATPYFVDTLFRADPALATPADGSDAAVRAEALRIFVTDMRAGTMGPADVRYLGQVVAKRTALQPADAEKRVADAFTQASKTIADAQNAAKQAADDARKAAATAALWMFVALLAGAFCASLAALYGGRRRDDFA